MKQSKSHGFLGILTLRSTNMAMENGPCEDVVPIENGDIPLLCVVYQRVLHFVYYHTYKTG